MVVKSILVVDDDVQFGRLIKRVFTAMGHRVEQISNPREIINRYNKFTPEVIFLDIFMPDLDGIEVANWLSKKGFNGKLVFMTGHDPTFLAAARTSIEPRIEATVATLEKPARVEDIRALLDERRVTPRKKTLKAATILHQNDNAMMKCIILDISDNGARLKPADPTVLPQNFRLMIAKGPSYDCEVIRRENDQIAVRFL
ncbi:MAG: response regulator [Alphaproteobacteria bacterium]|nr:response regulator [Alphaproteobacteria bacterium]